MAEGLQADGRQPADGRPFWPRVAELFWTEPDVAGRSSSPRGLAVGGSHPFHPAPSVTMLVSVIRLPIGAHSLPIGHCFWVASVGWGIPPVEGPPGRRKRSQQEERRISAEREGHAKESEEKNGRQDGGEAGAGRLVVTFSWTPTALVLSASTV
jgi:hypothetical protein